MPILSRCLQAPDSEQRYARWCTRQGRDMFVIECIPGNKKKKKKSICSPIHPYN